MFEQERWGKIIELVNKAEFLTVDDLVERLNTSPATIRRDIIKLSNLGLITKLHGGIKPASIPQGQIDYSKDFNPLYLSKTDPFLQDQLTNERDKKLNIAKKAASLIQDNDCIFLGTGSTTYYMIDYIKAQDVTIICNSLYHIRKLLSMDFSVYIPEGELNTRHQFIVLSDEALQRLESINIDKTFMGSRGINIESGLSTSSILVYQTKRRIIDLPSKHYILVDSSKLGSHYFISFAQPSEVTLISDYLPPEYMDVYPHIIAD